MAFQLKTLIVDDSSFSRSLLTELVQKSGHIVLGQASDGKEALAFLEKQSVDVVITDIVMPEMNGIQLTQAISKSKSAEYIIVISSLSQEHVILEAITAGATDFIPKPIDQEQINDSFAKIKKLMKED